MSIVFSPSDRLVGNRRERRAAAKRMRRAEKRERKLMNAVEAYKHPRR